MLAQRHVNDSEPREVCTLLLWQHEDDAAVAATVQQAWRATPADQLLRARQRRPLLGAALQIGSYPCLGRDLDLLGWPDPDPIPGNSVDLLDDLRVSAQGHEDKVTENSLGVRASSTQRPDEVVVVEVGVTARRPYGDGLRLVLHGIDGAGHLIYGRSERGAKKFRGILRLRQQHHGRRQAGLRGSHSRDSEAKGTETAEHALHFAGVDPVEGPDD